MSENEVDPGLRDTIEGQKLQGERIYSALQELEAQLQSLQDTFGPAYLQRFADAYRTWGHELNKLIEQQLEFHDRVQELGEEIEAKLLQGADLRAFTSRMIGDIRAVNGILDEYVRPSPAEKLPEE